MKSRIACHLALTMLLAFGCAESADRGSDGSAAGSGGGRGGMAGAGTGGGAASGSGGSVGSGGNSGTGGTTGSGGATGTGGRVGTGGTTGSGGTGGTPTATGGIAGFCPAVPAPDEANLQTVYTKWKTTFVTTAGARGFRRVQRTENGNDTVSEGIAYGMMAAVYLNDQTLFDDLWKYEQSFLNERGFMHWHINSGGTAIEFNGATDADEDMAFALVMASKKWGGRGTLAANYADLARAQIQRVWDHEVRHPDNTVKGGDAYDRVNASYLSPAMYKIFGEFTGQTANWNGVVDKSYQILNSCSNGTTGLAADWCSGSFAPDGNFASEACRTPFRIAMDACFYGEARAKTYLTKTATFFQGIGAPNIKGHYSLSGMPLVTWNWSATTGPAATAGLIDKAFEPLVLQGRNFVVEQAIGAAASGSGAYTYYGASWGVLSLLMLNNKLVKL